MLIKVKLEEKHLIEGKPCEPRKCAVALAIIDAFAPTTIRLIIDGDWAIIWNEDYALIGRFHLPQKVADLIDNYDLGMKVEPMEFELNNDHTNETATAA